MGKYYAKELEMDTFAFEKYFSEEDACNLHIWIGGNNDYIEYNKDFRQNRWSSLSNCYDAIEEELSWDNATEEEQLDEIIKDINYYFKKRDGGKSAPLTNREIKKLYNLCYEFTNIHGIKDENKLICQVLEIEYGEPFTECTIRGNSQGEWQYCIYPTRLDISKYENLYWGNFVEWAVSQTQLDDPDDFDYDDADYCISSMYRDDDIKNDLINQLGIQIKPEELSLIYLDGRITEALSQKFITVTRELERLLIIPRYKNYATISMNAMNQDTFELTIINKNKYDKIVNDVLAFLKVRGYKNAKVIEAKDFGPSSVKVKIELNIVEKEDKRDEKTKEREEKQKVDKNYRDSVKSANENQKSDQKNPDQKQDSQVQVDKNAELLKALEDDEIFTDFFKL